MSYDDDPDDYDYREVLEAQRVQAQYRELRDTEGEKAAFKFLVEEGLQATSEWFAVDTDFSGEDLSGVEVRPGATVYVSLYAFDFEGADLRGARLRGLQFDRCIWSGADLSGADLSQSQFRNDSAYGDVCNLVADGTQFIGAYIEWDFTDSRFREACLCRAVIAGESFTTAFDGADFLGAGFTSARFHTCTFNAADLSFSLGVHWQFRVVDGNTVNDAIMWGIPLPLVQRPSEITLRYARAVLPPGLKARLLRHGQELYEGSKRQVVSRPTWRRYELP